MNSNNGTCRKWRPDSIEQVVGQEHITTAITNSIVNNNIHHAILLTGPRGVGKTTMGRIIAKCLNCLTSDKPTATPCNQCNHCQEIKQGTHLDLVELDAASKTKVDDIREILDHVRYMPNKGRYKIYLIDEVHVSNSSFNALLKTLEEPPSYVILY